MSRFFVGLVVGVVLGAGGLYLGEHRPWVTATPGPDAVDAGTDAKTRKRARRSRGRRRGGHHQAGQDTGDEPIPELTANDRRQVWRGPAIEAPTRRIDFGGSGGGRRLSQDEIDRGIQSSSRGVVACIHEARGNAPISAPVTIEMLVSGQGRATKSRVRAPHYLLAHGLAPCVSRAVRSMRFPATGAPTVVTVPFNIK